MTYLCCDLFLCPTVLFDYIAYKHIKHNKTSRHPHHTATSATTPSHKEHSRAGHPSSQEFTGEVHTSSQAHATPLATELPTTSTHNLKKIYM